MATLNELTSVGINQPTQVTALFYGLELKIASNGSEYKSLIFTDSNSQLRINVFSEHVEYSKWVASNKGNVYNLTVIWELVSGKPMARILHTTASDADPDDFVWNSEYSSQELMQKFQQLITPYKDTLMDICQMYPQLYTAHFFKAPASLKDYFPYRRGCLEMFIKLMTHATSLDNNPEVVAILFLFALATSARFTPNVIAERSEQYTWALRDILGDTSKLSRHQLQALDTLNDVWHAPRSSTMLGYTVWTIVHATVIYNLMHLDGEAPELEDAYLQKLNWTIVR